MHVWPHCGRPTTTNLSKTTYLLLIYIPLYVAVDQISSHVYRSTNYSLCKLLIYLISLSQNELTTSTRALQKFGEILTGLANNYRRFAHVVEDNNELHVAATAQGLVSMNRCAVYCMGADFHCVGCTINLCGSYPYATSCPGSSIITFRLLCRSPT